jgi:pyruvate,water dikinase
MSLYSLTDKLAENLVGAKAYNLSLLTKAGIPVPKGFVLSAAVYAQRKQYDLIAAAQMICSNLTSPYVMVRSSAIGEDSQDHSFAGQLDSFKCVNDYQSIIKAIESCWDSLENSRSKQYGDMVGKNLSSMGVIIQEMIEPDYAGVFFTQSPNDDECQLIEWVEGHAEVLVSGSVTPSSLQFKQEKELENTPINGLSLLNISRHILQLYNIPQDIEWAQKNNTIYIVQTRPITGLKKKSKWSNTNVNENYPDKLSPFLYSLARTSYYHYFKNLSLILNVYPKNAEQVEYAFSNIIGTWGHHMYYNMSHIHSVLELSPFSKLFKNSFDDFVGYQNSSFVSRHFKSLWKKFYFSAQLIKQLCTLERKVKDVESTVDHFYEKSREALELSELNKNYHHFLHIRFNLWHKASFADMFAMITHGILGRVCTQIDAIKSQGIQNQLLQAIPNLVSNTPIFEIYSIYKIVQSKDEYRDLFTQSSVEIWETLKKNKCALFQRISCYLEEWGYRCSGELTFLTPNYCDLPESFIQILKSYIQSHPEDPSLNFVKKRQEQQVLLKQTISLSRKIKGFSKFVFPLVLRPLVELTSYSIGCRERVRLKQAKLYYGAKITLSKISSTLLEKLVLEEKNDIYFLTYDEISRILSGEEIDFIYYKNLIQLRRKSYDHAVTKPDNFSTFPADFTNYVLNQEEKSTDGLKGLPACGGEVTGKIRIIESMHEIHKLQKGDILVTKQTDPGWICAFPLISGLIVERGGMLSHGAIVAREFGIPAIVGVANALTELKDGQTVYLNAYTGVIKCLP